MKIQNLVLYLLNLVDKFQQYQVIKFFQHRINKYNKLIIFDVGAHQGESIKLFFESFLIKKIYSFEPLEINIKKIYQKKIFIQNKKNIYLNNFALGDKNKNVYINQTIETSSSTINNINFNSNYFKRKNKYLFNFDLNNYFQKKKIKMVMGNYFINKFKIKYIDILKIDTEGYEFKVIKGFAEKIKKFKFIYFEHHYDLMILKKYTFSDIHNYLIKKNFKKIYKSRMCFRKTFEYIYENTNI